MEKEWLLRKLQNKEIKWVTDTYIDSDGVWFVQIPKMSEGEFTSGDYIVIAGLEDSDER